VQPSSLPSSAGSDQSVSSEQTSTDHEEAVQRLLTLTQHDMARLAASMEPENTQRALDTQIEAAVSHLEELKAKLQACRNEFAAGEPAMPPHSVIKVNEMTSDVEANLEVCEELIQRSKLGEPVSGPFLPASARLDLDSTQLVGL